MCVVAKRVIDLRAGRGLNDSGAQGIGVLDGIGLKHPKTGGEASTRDRMAGGQDAARRVALHLGKAISGWLKLALLGVVRGWREEGCGRTAKPQQKRNAGSGDLVRSMAAGIWPARPRAISQGWKSAAQRWREARMVVTPCISGWIRYRSYSEASREARKLSRHHCVYHCQSCGGYHVGNANHGKHRRVA